MKLTIRLVAVLALVPFLEAHASDLPHPAPNRPLVGVIRWDGYSGSPVITQQQEMGFLKPEKWHSRAPWFFRKTGDPQRPLEFNKTYDKRAVI